MNVARKEGPDLNLLDLGLPAGDGRLVMERLRVMPALEGIPIIVLTARDVSLERDSLLAAGAGAVFPKPFDYDALVAAVRSQLGENSA